jgi:hypothetical protein
VNIEFPQNVSAVALIEILDELRLFIDKKVIFSENLVIFLLELTFSQKLLNQFCSSIEAFLRLPYKICVPVLV